MTKLQSSLLLAAVVLAGCTDTAPSSQAVSDVEISTVKLQRTPCFGICPVYEIELSSNGQVEFIGERFVEQEGLQTSTISPADFAAVVAEVRAIDFFSLRDEYRTEEDGCTAFITDQPGVNLTVTANGESKTVAYSGGCRGLAIGPELQALANTIDELGGSSQWVGRQRVQ